MEIDVNGISLHYEEAGAGDVIVFLHGNGEDRTIFSRTVDHLKGRHLCVSVDSRGHGLSGDCSERLTIPMLADDIVRFIEKKEFSGVTLIGFSDGGNVALEAAAVSDRVKNVVVIGANLYPKGMPFSVRFAMNLTRAVCLPFSFIPSVKRKRRLYYLMTHQPEITAEKLSRITARTLVIAGTRDNLIKTVHTEEIASKIPSAELRFIEGGGHFLFDTDLDELLMIIDEFVGS